MKELTLLPILALLAAAMPAPQAADSSEAQVAAVGELALGIVPPSALGFHLRETVEIAHASRIGHRYERRLRIFTVTGIHVAPHYRIDFSQTTGTSYWMNHCEHCAAGLGRGQAGASLRVKVHAPHMPIKSTGVKAANIQNPTDRAASIVGESVRPLKLAAMPTAAVPTA